MVAAKSHMPDVAETSMDEVVDKKSVAKDIRRYYCQYCGICRSKKKLISLHILNCHEDESVNAESDEVDSNKLENKDRHTCSECGASFRKPAHLKQHMLSHSIEYQDGGTSCEAPSRKPQSRTYSERPFSCPVEDCNATYKRMDHLTRHSLTHQGKLFTCPINNCNRKFGFKANMKRHITDLHEDDSACDGPKQCVCDEPGCGKTFKYPSKLKKHEDSHVKMDYVEVICGEPGCMKIFSNAECLKAHIKTSHKYVNCAVCGAKQLKKNFRRHERMHTANEVPERAKCNFEGCECLFSNASNLRQHIKAVHQELRPFTCHISGCGKKFSYKHVRNNHEQSGAHVYVQGDFLELDEFLRTQPRGGRKRKPLSVETLQRKRVVPLDQASILDNGTDYLRWLLSEDSEQQ